ncbi:ubiquitin carboxyl-terminal hydrolase 25-like [Homarus americanus]|uniref:ubiquitin carboxyl-terminal hydrolase 25-like n=1 Tax=Homarus americanus TaxID=6706 RepID=UPI001C485810|nr:ubiquitin carboxyl-terminal hydrolase 25-like [Homarus americanus]XP_042211162.1 ubiquitin carboxyl-terminal hydrolase 25-like [Homarus americanus]XP_042211163.1 ubiquitin carboxyl-terminal hydrolase 25-like [Homarus americanus]
MCGVARDKAGESDIVTPLEAAMPPSITVGSDPPKPTAGPGDHPPPQDPPTNKDIPTIDLSCDENDDLQKAIALSLQDQQGTTTLQGVSAEDQEVSRALEASLKESQPQATIDLLNPQERKRQAGVPVGLKNIGNSCWFNVVIQPLFHIPVFRDLILNFSQHGDTEEQMEETQKSSRQLVPALRKLFALMIGSNRKYIDPTHAVHIFQGQEMRKNAQQDVCEFTHKLLERLEEEFQQLLRRQGVEKESSGCHVSKDADFDNPIMKLFYGQSKKEICDDDDDGPKQEAFGQYPLHVMNYVDIHDSILASMASCMPNTLGDVVEPVQQETWFKMLPPVLIFSLSRYEYSHEKKRAEKVHNKFEFPEFLYMDRYMEMNKKIIKEKHIKVAKLKGELNCLKKTLDRYQKYGTGEAKYPIGDILKYTLDFAQTGLSPVQEAEANSVPSPSMMEVDGVETCENDIEMVDVPEVKKEQIEERDTEKENKANLIIKGEEAVNDLILKEELVEDNLIVKEESVSNNLCTNEREADEEPQQMPSPSKRMRILPPAPRNITTSELSILHSCLSRWLQDINLQVAELRRCISELEQQLNQMYDEPYLKRIPYRLHAVVVHEGQASGGHYWVYTFDNINKLWMKFNDIQVVESDWDELLQDSVGGQNNASAYCLLYIDESRYNSLFPQAPENMETMMANIAIDLQEYVKNDNLAFMRELEEWDLKQEKSDQGKDPVGASQDQQSGSSSWDNNMPLVPVTAPNSPDIICVHESDEASFFTEVQTMLTQTVLDTLMKKDENALQRECGTVLNTILISEFERLQSFADAKSEGSPYCDPSILDFGVYLIRNNQNVDSLLRWYACEVILQVAQKISESTPVVEKVALEATQCLQQLRDQHQRTDGPEYRGWRRHYHTLIDCAWHLVYGYHQFEKGNLERALPLLLRACRIHTELKERPPSGNRKTLDRQVLWKCRQACLLALNEQLVEAFLNGEEQQVGDIPGNVTSLIVPALAQLNASGVEEDKATIAEVRAHWCELLERDISPPAKNKMLEHIFDAVLCLVDETKGIMPLQIPRPPTVLILYKQYVDACNAIMTASSKCKAQTSDL